MSTGILNWRTFIIGLSLIFFYGYRFALCDISIGFDRSMILALITVIEIMIEGTALGIYKNAKS